MYTKLTSLVMINGVNLSFQYLSFIKAYPIMQAVMEALRRHFSKYFCSNDTYSSDDRCALCRFNLYLCLLSVVICVQPPPDATFCKLQSRGVVMTWFACFCQRQYSTPPPPQTIPPPLPPSYTHPYLMVGDDYMNILLGLKLHSSIRLAVTATE